MRQTDLSYIDRLFSWNNLIKLAFVSWSIIIMAISVFATKCAFSPKTAELKLITNSINYNVPTIQSPQEQSGIASLESYKATYDLFNSQFSQLLVVLGFFCSIFGLAIPAGGYLLQRQSLKAEKENLKREITEMIDRELEHLKKIQTDQLTATGQAFFATCALFVYTYQHAEQSIARITSIQNFMTAFDHGVNCFVKAKKQNELIDFMTNNIVFVDAVKKENKDLYQKAVKNLEENSKQNSFFVSGYEIKKMLDKRHHDLYEKFKEIYEPIFPWKFSDNTNAEG